MRGERTLSKIRENPNKQEEVSSGGGLLLEIHKEKR